MMLENTMIYLVAYPAVGKLTTATVLCAATGAVLVDNHLANNPIFRIIGADGVKAIPAPAWDRVDAIRDILFDTILSVAPCQSSFVLTNVLFDDDEGRALFAQVKELAEKRRSLFVPVVLQCAKNQHLRRVASAGRAKHMRATSVSGVEKIISRSNLLPIVHPNLLTLNNTNLSAANAAKKIMAHISTL